MKPSLLWAIVGVAVFSLLTGCASVSETRRYYRPTTAEVFPPKSSSEPMPILDHQPARAHRVIGRLAFSSAEDRSFMLEAAEYNGREAGADAVVITSLHRSEVPWQRWVPGSTTYEPVSTTVIRRSGSRGYDYDRGYDYRRRRYYDQSSVTERAPKICKKHDDDKDKDKDKDKKKKKKKHDRDDEDYRYSGYNSGYSSTVTEYVPRYNPGYMERGVTVRHSIDAQMIRYLGSRNAARD